MSEELLEYKSIKYWMDSLATEKNRYKCIKWFPKFLKYCEAQGYPHNPDEIIAQRREDLKSDDPKIRRRWEHICKAFYHKLYEEYEQAGKSTYTPWTILSVVRGFFSHHDYDLKFKRNELKQPYRAVKEHIPTNIEIRAMYMCADSWLDKALLLTAYQTGLSEIDICELNIEDVDWNEEPPIYFEKLRQKTKILTQTCFGYDVVNAIRRMLRVRGNPKTGPLFLTRKGSRFEVRWIRHNIQKLAKRAEIGNGKRFAPKNLRTAFSNAMEEAGVNKNIVEAMLGHKLPYAGAYSKHPKPVIVAAYKQGYEKLSIDEREETEQQRQFLVEMIQEQNRKIKALESVLKATPRRLDANETKLVQLETEIAGYKELIGRLIKALEEHGITLEEISA